MATGRTLEQWRRIYVGGYDISKHIRKTDTLKWEYAVTTDAGLSEAIKNGIGPGQAALGIGTLNGFLDTTALTGLHVLMSGAGVKRAVMVVQGIRGEPAAGDQVYCGEFTQLDYKSAGEGGNAVVTIPFGDADAAGSAIAYSKPWGVLLHAKGAAEETGANTGTGIDCGETTTTRGAFMMYQIFAVSGTGNVTLSVQEAGTNLNGSFAALNPALSSGAIAHTSVPCAGIVALGTTQTIKQFTRWQMALSGITGCTFALALVRGN
jgi:hypothetical protein